mmetsp:Transcript_1099/g.2764  ORF Transcript_1099/g.2764 Transcript_1099/m.2764 type:complete len:201 (+) Transcript_1099:145-747(+)
MERLRGRQMERRSGSKKDDAVAVPILDEDEQEAIVYDLRRENEVVVVLSRRFVVATIGVIFCAVGWSLVTLATRRPQFPGDTRGLPITADSVHRVAALVRRMVLVYCCTLAECVCATLIALGDARPRRFRLLSVGAVLACVPPLAYGPMLFDLGAPAASWLVVLAAPVCYGLAFDLDKGMNDIARDLDELSTLKYKHKGV